MCHYMYNYLLISLYQEHAEPHPAPFQIEMYEGAGIVWSTGCSANLSTIE